MSDWRFGIERVDYEHRLRMAAWRERDDGGRDVLLPLGIGVVPPELAGATPTPDWFDKPAPEVRQFLQALVDACWQADIRPTGVEDFRRTADTQRRHLDDMRALVGKAAGVDLGK